jgi:hypothetical protein
MQWLGIQSVRNVPVNYAIRFNGLVTPSPPAALGMVSEARLICQRDAAQVESRCLPSLLFHHDPCASISPLSSLYSRRLGVVPSAGPDTYRSTRPTRKLP